MSSTLFLAHKNLEPVSQGINTLCINALGRGTSSWGYHSFRCSTSVPINNVPLSLKGLRCISLGVYLNFSLIKPYSCPLLPSPENSCCEGSESKPVLGVGYTSEKLLGPCLVTTHSQCGMHHARQPVHGWWYGSVKENLPVDSEDRKDKSLFRLRNIAKGRTQREAVQLESEIGVFWT